jgi:hypothetical protein
MVLWGSTLSVKRCAGDAFVGRWWPVVDKSIGDERSCRLSLFVGDRVGQEAIKGGT